MVSIFNSWDTSYNIWVISTLCQLTIHVLGVLMETFLRAKFAIYCVCNTTLWRIHPWRGRRDTLYWRHNDHDGVSNYQPHGCLLNRLFRRRSKKTSKLRVTGLCAGNSPGPANSPYKGPVTRKMFPFDDVIMMGVFIQTVSGSKQRDVSRGGCAQQRTYLGRGAGQN